MRQWFDVPAGNGAEQDKFQQLVIRKGLRAAREKAVAQAFAVIGDIGGKPTGRQRRYDFDLVRVEKR